jgi:P-type Cu+ transporter
VFDKTGTMTIGKAEITDLIPNNEYDNYHLLNIESFFKIKSEHPIRQVIVKKQMKKNILIPLVAVNEFKY